MARPSASECKHDSVGNTPVCPDCGGLREAPEGADHFALLGLPRSLSVDEEALRERFYALSKLTHPDRFVQASPKEALLANRWTSAVNRAYQTLRDPDRRSRYLLELHGMADRKDQIPMDLAEQWFEVQDEGPEQIAAFRKEIEGQLAGTQGEWEAIAGAWSRDERGAVARLGALMVKRKYLASMLTDIERKIGGR